MKHPNHPPIQPRPTRSPSNYPRSKVKPSLEAYAWLSHHFYVLISSLAHLIRTPLSSLMTVAVIGIALALPTGLYLLLENVQHIRGEWGGAAQISLFLKEDINNEKVHALADQLLEYNDISSVQVITPAEALDEYRKLSGFEDALAALDKNPLPAVLVIRPTHHDATASQKLLEHLNQLPQVNIAQFDMLWLKRLFAIVEIMRRGVLILAALLSLAVLLIIGNTIRLTIDNRSDEIEITKLVGGTDSFIRRPFLYTGFWYGLLGGAIAWLLINISFWLLENPVKQLTALYYSQFELVTLDLLSSLILLTIGAFLGLAGAGLAVGQHLKDF